MAQSWEDPGVWKANQSPEQAGHCQDTIGYQWDTIGHQWDTIGHHRTPAGHLQNSPCLGAMTKALRCPQPCPGQGQQLPCIWG